MSEQYIPLILASLKTLNEDFGKDSLENVTDQTEIFGATGALTSIELVALIADLEDRISDEFGKNVVLADEKAMSQYKSPFKNAASLSTFIDSLLKEQVA